MWKKGFMTTYIKRLREYAKKPEKANEESSASSIPII